MDLMHSTPSMYYEYDAHVKGELLVIMKNSQSVNLLIFISNTLIELFNDFGSDRDGILKRPTMYFNLWRYKVVRHRYSNPMIQPKPEGSTQGYPLVSVEVLRYDKRSKSEIKGRMQTEMELTLEQTQQGVSYEVSMEILLEPTSNKLMVGDLCDSLRIKLVTTGKKRWCDSIRIKLVPGIPDGCQTDSMIVVKNTSFLPLSLTKFLPISYQRLLVFFTLPAPNANWRNKQPTASSSPYRKQLTQKEMEDKRSKGLCFYYDQKYFPGHKCSGQVFLLEVIVDNEDQEGTRKELEECLEEEIVWEQEPVVEGIVSPQISLNAITGVYNYQTMRVMGYVGKSELHILVDSGTEPKE
ncbi:hypothetical protein Tco_0853743 [Tanacetum coccineum]